MESIRTWVFLCWFPQCFFSLRPNVCFHSFFFFSLFFPLVFHGIFCGLTGFLSLAVSLPCFLFLLKDLNSSCCCFYLVTLLWGNQEQKQRGVTGRKIIASSSSKALGDMLSIFREKFCGGFLFVLFSSHCKVTYFSDIPSNECIVVIFCWAVARIQVLKDASVQMKVQTRPYAKVKSTGFI